MRFRFQLDRLMRYRKIEVDVAQRDFAEATARVREQEVLRSQMAAHLHQSLGLRFELQKRGGVISEDLATIQTFIEGQKLRIAEKDHLISGLQKIAEDKRVLLVEHLKELKTLEKLREKRWNEFRDDVHRREAKSADDRMVQQFGHQAAKRDEVE